MGRRSGGHEQAWICRSVRMVWVPGKVGNGWEEGPVGMSEHGSWTCANGMGAREKVGNG